MQVDLNKYLKFVEEVTSKPSNSLTEFIDRCDDLDVNCENGTHGPDINVPLLLTACCFGSIEYRGDTFYLRDHAVHRILYGINEFHTVKPSSTFFSERDTWFLKNPDHIESARNYMQGIDKLRSIVPEYWVNGTFDRGIKGCMSKPYWLE